MTSEEMTREVKAILGRTPSRLFMRASAGLGRDYLLALGT